MTLPDPTQGILATTERATLREPVDADALARDLHHPLLRAADHDHLTTGCLGAFGDRLQPRHIGGEGGHGHPRRRLGDDRYV